MDIHFPGDENENGQQKVSITIECQPVFAEWILALSTPLASNGVLTVGLAALPEALMQIGSFLDFEGDRVLFDQWSNLHQAFIMKFMDLTKAYSLAGSFDASRWRRNFIENLDSVESELGGPADKLLFDAIRSVVQLLGNRLAGSDQHLVYCDEIGTPLTFNNWVERILTDPKITDEMIARAHLYAFDPLRLKALLEDWTIYSSSHKNILEDDIPF
jgi:hypothetical protein